VLGFHHCIGAIVHTFSLSDHGHALEVPSAKTYSSVFHPEAGEKSLIPDGELYILALIPSQLRLLSQASPEGVKKENAPRYQLFDALPFDAPAKNSGVFGL